MKRFVLLLLIFFVFSNNVSAKMLMSLDIRLTHPIKNEEAVNMKSDEGFILKNGEGSIIGAIWEREIVVKYSKGLFMIYLPSGERAWKDSMKDLMLMHPDGEFTPVYVEDKGYRGNIYFKTHEGSPLVINRIILDIYLMGVVPQEIGKDAPYEALKAQVIASRSFAIANQDKFIDKGYNLDDTTFSQVYFGIEKENEETNRAIKETPNQVLKYDGKVCSAIFFSVSSGITESASDVWGGKEIPYLSNVIDPYSSKSKNFNWEYSISKKELEERMAKAGKSVGSIKSIELVLNPQTESVKNVTIKGDKTITMTGNHFRLMVSAKDLKSHWFRFGENGTKISPQGTIKFTGRGYGHGVGMPQAGAREMANQGYSAKEILEFYFKGANVLDGRL